MPRTCYLVARPETVVSIINKGCLPENLRDKAAYVKQTRLELYETPEAAAANSDTKNSNSFILNYELPDSTSKYNIEYEPETEITKICCDYVDIAALQKIYVFNKASHKLLLKLLNSICHVPIVECPEIFTQKKLVQYQEKLEESLGTPSGLVNCLKTGDLLGSKMQTLINTVNCVGVMGKGIAFAFKQRYPSMFTDYKKKCDNEEVEMGKPYLFKVTQNRFIVNFPTKKHWKNSSNLEDVKKGLEYLANHAATWGITSMAIPPLGCGNGGLNWKDVQPLIMQYLGPLKIPIEIYEPFASLETSKTNKKESSKNKHKLKRESSSSTLYSFFQPENKSFLEDTLITPSTKRIKLTSIDMKIDYVYQEGKITAFDKNIKQQIGLLEVVQEEDNYWLNHIEVKQDLQRRGIGTHLLRKAIECFPKLQISLISSKEGYGIVKYRLNEDVASFIESCIARGIVNKEINCCETVPLLSKSDIAFS